MNAKRIVPPVVIALALAVNYPHIARLWSGGDARPGSAPDLLAPEANGEDAPATATDTAVTFVPVVRTDHLVDPFAGSRTGAETESLRARQALLPEVTMILRTGSSRRAVIDRTVVGVGDEVPGGVVQAIEADHVLVHAASGATQRLALKELDRKEMAPKERASPPATRADQAPSVATPRPQEQQSEEPREEGAKQ